MTSRRFGKHPPKHDYRTLRFGDYAKKLAAPPAKCSVLDRVYANLKIDDPKTIYPMDANDRLGDCTIAAMAHAITTYRALLGKEVRPAEGAIVKLYAQLTGGPDTGLNELDVLNHWRTHKDLGDEILAFVRLDPKNHTHVQQAIQLFGGVYLGFQVQKNCIEDFDAGKAWTPQKLTNEGHAVYAVAYDENEVTVLTWGNTQRGTWAWWDECVDEAYAILPPEAKKTGFAPGFDFAQLETDLASVAH